MKVFTVTNRYMQTRHCEEVFSSLQKAESYLENRTEGDNGHPQIEEMYVIGEVNDSDVFTAETYDHPSDLHYFEALYGTYDAAKAAARLHGLTRNLKIDGRST